MLSTVPTALPIESTLPELLAALSAHPATVLQAPPGAGKSTGVPLALLATPWLGGKKILLLEPRQIAARSVAARMAQVLRERVGDTVGYRTRLDTKVSRLTRIEVVTQGVLTRMLQQDASLDAYGCVIFDEFHERSLESDLGLTLCLEVQETIRDDLKLLLMSATLDGKGAAALLGGAPLVTATGRAFPVEIRWRESSARPSGTQDRTSRDIAPSVTAAIVQALTEEPGDALVFLPGQGEIRRVERLLADERLPTNVQVLPLYGELGVEAQQRAIEPGRGGTRKIVLATNVAETSLTIEGVRIVIDAGLERRARFDPTMGMSRLDTVRIARASAEQRAGRAGRLEPGVCYRLWSQHEHAALAANRPAEILEADLASLALELTHWGTSDPSALRWLDPPPSGAYSQATELLTALEALDAAGKITAHGRAMARLGAHPRLAHMMLRGQDRNLGGLACNIAALLGERDVLRAQDPALRTDFCLRVAALYDPRNVPAAAEVDRGARERALRSAEVFARRLEVAANNVPSDVDRATGELLALAYPDRVGKARGDGARYLLVNGRGAALPVAQSLGRAPFLSIAELDAGEREARIYLAAALDSTSIPKLFANRIQTVERIEWDAREQAVIARREQWLGALKLEEQALDADPAKVTAALLTGIRTLGLQALPWSEPARRLQTRVLFARGLDAMAAASWPALSDADLLATLETWLAPWLDGMTRRDHLARLDLHAALLALLTWPQQRELDELMPTHWQAPSGSHIPIDYSSDPPTIAVRLQEVFGLDDTPRIGGGRVPLMLHLLSPARRPVQVTRDLKSFWTRTYHEVRKELKGRYPKHHWPEDPTTALPTARAKPRGT
jgi:ATP-dependent helicase HrpB